MAEYEIRISGVHYGANGDSVAGQKDTEEMHVRTRELLSRIDRVRPIVTQNIYGDKNEFQDGAQLLKMGIPEGADPAEIAARIAEQQKQIEKKKDNK